MTAGPGALDVQEAMRWNSPSYGVEEQDWFLSFYCSTDAYPGGT